MLTLIKKLYIGVMRGSITKQGIARYLLTEFRCSRSLVPVSTERAINIELTNICNQKCEFCPTGLDTLARPKGTMSLKTFKRIAQQLSTHTEIQFAGYGEPFLNKELEVFLEYAAGLHLKNVDIYSNFEALKEARIRKLLDHPFRKLVISLDAMSRERFMVYKGCDQFDIVLKNIEILADEAKKRKTVGQKLCVQMVVTRKNVDQVSEFQEYIRSIGLAPITKSLNTYVTFPSEDKIREWEVTELSRYRNRGKYSRRCPWVWGGMLVFWNGDVTVCCEDPMGTSIYGNVNEKSLLSLINGARADFRRQYFRDPGKIKICQGCHFA